MSLVNQTICICTYPDTANNIAQLALTSFNAITPPACAILVSVSIYLINNIRVELQKLLPLKTTENKLVTIPPISTDDRSKYV
jgi:hypothetical protein